MYLSAFIHLMIMSLILYAAAPLIFHAQSPENPPLYFGSLAVFTAVSLSIGCVLGLADVYKRQPQAIPMILCWTLKSRL